MRTQCSSKLLEFEDHGRRRLLAKKLIFLFDFLRVPPSWSFVPLRGYFLSFVVQLRAPSARSRGRLDGVGTQKMSKRS